MVDRCKTGWFGGLMAASAVLMLGAAAALAGTGQPSDGQLGMQNPVTEVATEINRFHDNVNYIIAAITAFVLVLLVWVILRYNARANPNPSRTTHNTVIEVVWTVVPILILIVIGIQSFKLLFLQYSYPKPDLTIKAIGNAWFWEHEFPDQGVKVTSNMVRDEDVLKTEIGEAEFAKRYGNLTGTALSAALYRDAQSAWAKQKLVRQLSVDNEIAVPVNKVVHVLVTSADVIHAWTIPSFGSKTQAVPGRNTSTWFKATKTGVYYGQCSVLCGKLHSGMPIAIRVVEQAAFDQWVAAAKARQWDRAKQILRAATDEAGTTRLAGTGAAVTVSK